ncbi:hypothetical protein D3C71_1157380 [compost metagenome]
MDVGDGIARGGNQRIAAALGFAHLHFNAAQPPARLQVDPFIAHHGQQVVRLLAQGDGADAVGGRIQQLLSIDLVGQQDHRDVLAAGGDLLGQQQLRDAVRGGRQDQVDGLGRDGLGQLRRILRPERTHRDATVAQRADDGFGAFGAVVNDQQAQGYVFGVLHSVLPWDGV